jgi:hypothetical protein
MLLTITVTGIDAMRRREWFFNRGRFWLVAVVMLSIRLFSLRSAFRPRVLITVPIPLPALVTVIAFAGGIAAIMLPVPISVPVIPITIPASIVPVTIPVLVIAGG